MGRARRRALVADALASVGLADAAGAYPWQLSGGTQQRVAIARALAYQPEVLLMDEPFTAVDAQTRADPEDPVRRLWRERGITVLFVTHDIDEAVYLGERALVLSASPTVAQERLEIDLPADRDQLHTLVAPRFAELRTRVYEQSRRRNARGRDGWPPRRGGPRNRPSPRTASPPTPPRTARTAPGRAVRTRRGRAADALRRAARPRCPSAAARRGSEGRWREAGRCGRGGSRAGRRG